MRRALFSIMLVGIVAVGATLGGLAAFSDTEKSSGNTFTAGEFDLKVDWVQYWNGELEENQSFTDLNEMPIFTLDDVKPGDSGKAAISLHVFTNDAWLCMELSPTSADDVSSNEPELLEDEEDNEDCLWDGELAQNLYIELWQENDGNMEWNSGEPEIYTGLASDICGNGCTNGDTLWYNLDQNLDTGDGLQPLIGCENYYIGMNWWIDGPSVGNEIQSDEFSFDISFFAYQYRHQEDNNPCVGPSCEDVETLYLMEDFEGYLWEVDLDNENNRANLSKITTFPSDFDDSHIACTPDGENIYAISSSTGNFGVYTVLDNTFTDLGTIGNFPYGVVLTACAPDNELWMASAVTDNIYTVDLSGPTAVNVGDTGIDVVGADIAFDAYGTLYLYSNATESLYTIDTTTGEATLVGYTGGTFTGLAIRAGGTGDLVGSSTTLEDGSNDDTIWVFDRSNGSKLKGYPMYLDGERYLDYDYGDMTVGTICVYPEETD